MRDRFSDGPTGKAFAGAATLDESAEPLVELEDVALQFGRTPVLRDISLAIRRGETVTVIGESGCGKTVLLKLIIGLLEPTAGRVHFDGMDLAELSEKELTRTRIRFGFLFQGAALFDSLSVERNVAFGLREHGTMPEDEMHEFVCRLVREVGLAESVLDKKPAELSGGMKKRVGLARALAMQPEIILYDEPTTGLDPIMSDVINELIVQTRARHRVTSIVVTHDMRAVQKVADRIVMLAPVAQLEIDEPQVVFQGSPKELAQCNDARVSQFIRGESGARLMEKAYRN